MADTLEIANKRLTSTLWDDMCSAYPLNVRAGKIIAKDAVLIQGKRFASLEISAARFNETVTFIDCQFSGDLILREVRATSLSFINCDFGKDVIVFGTTASVSLSLVRSRISGRFTLDGASTPKLDVQTMSATTVSIAASEIQANIQALSFDHLSVSNLVQIDSIAGIEQLAFNNCAAHMLHLRHLGLQQGAKLCIETARIGEIVLDDIKMDGADFRLASASGENIYFKKCALVRSKLVFEHVLASGVFAIKECTYEGTAIDISSVMSPNLGLDPLLLDFVKPGADKMSPIFDPSMSEENRLQTLKLLKDKFSREHRYDLEDDVFYILKNYEAQQRMTRLSWWKRPASGAAYFLNRYVMGWGVRLRNPLLSAFLIIQCCAVMYYVMLGLNQKGKSIQYIGQQIEGFYGATIFSLLAFFGQHADAQITGNAQITLALGEFILGVAMTTIIVGILIRKLVR